MEILAIKRTPSEQMREELNLAYLGGPEDLNYVVGESDFILLTVALTPATRGIIGKKQIDLMKPTAYIVNVGRAALIHVEASYIALKEKKIAGAGLDVWWVPHWWDPTWYPEIDKPSHFPIWELENVVCTPHSAGSSEVTKYSDRPIEVMVENIKRVLEGKPPLSPVDKEHR